MEGAGDGYEGKQRVPVQTVGVNGTPSVLGVIVGTENTTLRNFITTLAFNRTSV